MKTTKRALFSSVMALILCFSMLVGTTFAWFTDSVESGVNQIVAGTLDVELYNAIGIDETKKVSAETKLFDEIKYWEPGVVAYENLTVANLGNLALKYQLSVNFDNATANVNGETLAKVLKVGFVEGGIQSTTREGALAEVTEWLPLASFAQTGELAEQNETNTYGIVIYWEPSDIDNDFNMNNGKGGALSIDLGIKLVATQLTAEYDSFGNDYDSMAGGKYHVQFGFNNPADLLAFAPVAGDAASSGLSITPDGKAQIDKSGAWYEIEADLSENEYVVEYELDITDLAIGENVTVDTGEQVGWGSTPIMLERGSTKVYYGLAKNEYIGELQGTVVTVTHVYKYNSDNKLEITTIVSDGVDSVTYTKAVASSAQTKLYWDIYFATEAGKATMDDFSVKTADVVVDSGAELANVIAQGGEIVLGTDITAVEPIVIPAGVKVELDLNGKTLTADAVTAAFNDTHVVDSKGTGKIDSDSVSLMNDNKQLAVHHEGNVTLETLELAEDLATNGTTGLYKFYIKNEAAATMLDDAIKTGEDVSLFVRVTWTKGGVDKYNDYACSNTLLQEYAGNWDEKMFTLTFSDLTGIENLACTVMVTSGGVTVEA